MISEEQQEQASLYALGTLNEVESRAFETELLRNAELHSLVRSMQGATDLLALATPTTPLPSSLRDRVLEKIDEVGRVASRAPFSDSPGAHGVRHTAAETLAGLRFIEGAESKGWKQLPVPGAYIKLLSLEKERGYAVLLGKLDPGVRYPAHVNAGPEDFFVLTGDLVIGDRKLVAGDFHHADKGSQHAVNYSVEGCTLLSVLTTDDPLVAFAMA